MKEINGSLLVPGLVFHTRSKGFLCRNIRRVLSFRGPACWGCHDGMVVRDPVTGELGIGESVTPRARITPLREYNREIREGTTEVKVLRVSIANYAQQELAAVTWVRDINNTIYDFGAFPLLLLKSIFGDISNIVAGWEWANWCTEGIAYSYMRVGCYAWSKRNPTPKTTENRMREGVMVDITDSVTVG